MTIRASSMLEHEKRSMCLWAFERVLRPFCKDMDEVIQTTHLLIDKHTTESPPVPSAVTKTLRDLKNLEFVICHAPVEQLSLNAFRTLMELAREKVIAFCHSLIEKKLEILHEENYDLHRKVSVDTESLKSMEEVLSQLPLTQAVVMINDEFSNLQNGKDHNSDYCTDSTLEKKNKLFSKIQTTRNVIEQKSLVRCKIRHQIHALENFYEQLVTRKTFVKLQNELNEIKNARLLPNDNIMWIKRFDSLKRNVMGCLRGMGKADIERYYQTIQTVNASAWILSKGEKLENLKIKEVYTRVAYAGTEQCVPQQTIIQLADPALLIAGPPGSGKTILCHQILQSYVVTDPIFTHVHQFELVILLSASDVCQNSFSAHIKEKIIPESMRFEDPYIGLQKMNTLFVVDFNTGYSNESAAALKELLRKLGKNKIIITCRSVLSPVIQKTLRNTKTSFQATELLPLTENEVYRFSCDALASAFPRGSIVDSICRRFCQALNYRDQASLLYPLSLIYLLAAWNVDSTFVEACTSMTELLAFHYNACKKKANHVPRYAVLAQQRLTDLRDPVFDVIEEKAVSIVLHQADDVISFSHETITPLDAQKVCPFVISSRNSEQLFVHSVVVDYLAAEYVLEKLDYKIWSFKRKITLKDFFGEQENNPTFGKFTLVYLFLSSMLTRNYDESVPLKVPLDELDTLASLFCNSYSSQRPDWLDLLTLLREARFHPRVSKFIKKHTSIVSSWSPFPHALRRNLAVKTLIKESAYAPRVVKICGTEPALKSIVKALSKVPSVNIFCHGKGSTLDEVICHLEGTRILREFEGSLQEKGCSALKGMMGLKKLMVTVSSMAALDQLSASLRTPAVKRQLELLDVEITFKIESKQHLPSFELGRVHFTLRLDNVNLEPPGAAVRILNELACPCQELIVKKVDWPANVERDLRLALAPTLVIFS